MEKGSGRMLSEEGRSGGVRDVMRGGKGDRRTSLFFPHSVGRRKAVGILRWRNPPSRRFSTRPHCVLLHSLPSSQAAVLALFSSALTQAPNAAAATRFPITLKPRLLSRPSLPPRFFSLCVLSSISTHFPHVRPDLQNDVMSPPFALASNPSM